MALLIHLDWGIAVDQSARHDCDDMTNLRID
jgi:hypothetical protein